MRTKIYTMSEKAVDAFVAQHGETFSGRSVRRTSPTTLVYYASNGDHSQFAEFVARLDRVVRGASAQADPATPKQIAYLRRLMASENGYLSGLSRLSDEQIAGMSKDEASRMISNLSNWA